MLKFLVILLPFIVAINTEDLPSYFQRCRRRDILLHTCLLKSANLGWAKFVEEYNLDKVPVDTVKVVPYFATGIVKSYLTGFKNVKFTGIFINFNTRKLDVEYNQPVISMIGNYSMKGSFLGFPLDDAGYENVTYTNGQYRYVSNFTIESRNGENYMQLTQFKLSQNTKKLIVDVTSFENPKRGEQITTLFNNNWRILNFLIQTTMEEVFSESYTPVLNKFLSTIPLKKLFA